MSRGFTHSKKRWSKLQKQIKNLFVKELNLKIHCTVYVEITKQFTFESSRHWITLDKEIIWDFPGPFMEWKCSDPEKSIKPFFTTVIFIYYLTGKTIYNVTGNTGCFLQLQQYIQILCK